MAGLVNLEVIHKRRNEKNHTKELMRRVEQIVYIVLIIYKAHD